MITRKEEKKMKRTHARIVTEGYIALRNCNDPVKVLSKYGRKTRDDIMTMYNQEKAKELNMTMDEFNKWLMED